MMFNRSYRFAYAFNTVLAPVGAEKVYLKWPNRYRSYTSYAFHKSLYTRLLPYPPHALKVGEGRRRGGVTKVGKNGIKCMECMAVPGRPGQR